MQTLAVAVAGLGVVVLMVDMNEGKRGVAGQDSECSRSLEVRIPTGAARFDLHGMGQQLVRTARGTVQGPATKVGGGPKGHARALALPTPPGLHK